MHDIGVLQALGQCRALVVLLAQQRAARGGCTGDIAIDLATGPWLFVEQDDRQPGVGGLACGGHAGRPGADDDEIGLSHSGPPRRPTGG